MYLDIKGSGSEDSFLNYYQFDVTYDNFYFYPNAYNDATKIQIAMNYSLAFPADCNGQSCYIQSVTPVAGYNNKFTVKVAIRQLTNCGSFTYFHTVFKSIPIIQYTIKFKAVNPAITCMPSVGKISNIKAVYDNVASEELPPANPTNYVIQQGNLSFRPAVVPTVSPCDEAMIDYVGITPTSIRAGMDEILTIRAYKNNPLGGPATQVMHWFGERNSNLGQGNVQFRNCIARSALADTIYIAKMDSMDIIEWNDSVIRIKVSSKYIEHNGTNPNDQINTLGANSASGFVNVTNKNGVLKRSKTKLHVEYAALNQSDGIKKYRYYFANKECKKQLPLRCHNSLSLTERNIVFAAARHWNKRLGYDVFQIDENTVSYIYHPTECIVMKKDTLVESALGVTNYKYLDEMGTNKITNIANSTEKRMVNLGFDIYVRTKYRSKLTDPFTIIQWHYDTPQESIVSTDTTYVFTNGNNSPFISYYEMIAHELGHGLGLDHCLDKEDPLKAAAKEIMYPTARYNTAANRVSITSGGRHSLKGVRRLLNDSKNTIWNDVLVNTFGNTVNALTLAKSPSNRNICGYDNTKNATVTLSTQNNGSTAGAVYQWYYNGNNYIANDTTFAGQGNTNLAIKSKRPPYSSTNPAANNLTVTCTAYLSSCKAVTDTFLFKASANVVLQPTPSRCLNGSLEWTLPKPTPADGTFTAYNMASPNTPITNIVKSATATSIILKDSIFKSVTASTYKIVYDNNSTVCPIRKDSTYMSTFANCTTLSSTVHKIYINEVSKNQTAFRNGGTNDPCKSMKLYFTALGTFNANDQLIIKLSDATGAIDITPTNINNRIIGTYTFASNVPATITGKSDSIKLDDIYSNIVVASPDYKMRIFLKRAGAPTLIEWGEVSPEKINFISANYCAVVNPPCCAGGTRTAPNQFAAEEIQLYPNPTTNHFTLQTPEYDNVTEVMIVNTQGQIVDKQHIFGTTNEIQTHEMPNGVYYVRIAQGERSTTLKLVVIK
jgi:predicted Zn-dependent protease